MYWELPDVEAGFRKSRGTRDQNSQHPLNHRKTRELKKKKSSSASLTMLKPLTVCITTNCGRFLKNS